MKELFNHIYIVKVGLYLFYLWKNSSIESLVISGKEFSDSFLELRQKLIYECDGFLKELGSEKLKDFYLDPRSYGFGSLISFLRAECDNFSENYQNEAMILSKTVF